ncbi:keratin-associated protein 13-1-like isoform X1 [Mus pahari]|uniref:keratin-associated protein 13-1-like isoform X1 n=1 Tax=Mus pahari TaxID=10093 RepID=UPI000A31139A|nr:keratin-associated protein 13-1-like isoform X1 [Mus pahari]
MAYNCCSGNFSSRSLRSCLPSSSPCSGSSYPSNLVYTTTSCSPSTCQLDSSLRSGCQKTCIEPISCSPSTCQLSSSLRTGCQETCIGPIRCQETCIEPIRCQRSCVVTSPCQKPCYYPRSSTPCSPCQGTYAGSLGFGSRSCSSLDYGSRSCYPVGYGNSGFRSLDCGVYGFPSMSYGSRFYYPTYMASSSCQPCYRPICGAGIYGINC